MALGIVGLRIKTMEFVLNLSYKNLINGKTYDRHTKSYGGGEFGEKEKRK